MATTPITTIHIVHESDAENAASVQDALVGEGTPDNTSAVGFLARIAKLFASLSGGTRNAKIITTIENATAGIFATATATLTFANITANDTMTIGGTVLTWKAAAGNENEITIGADLAAATTNMTAAINVHSILSQFLSASGNTSTGVVTLTAKTPGLLPTMITLATSDATLVTYDPATKMGNVTSTQTQAPLTINRGVA